MFQTSSEDAVLFFLNLVVETVVLQPGLAHLFVGVYAAVCH